jgi:hypothetical protein
MEDKSLGFEVLTVGNVNIAVVWDVIPYSLALPHEIYYMAPTLQKPLITISIFIFS